MARSGDQARAAIIAHAERLFAERGIEGVSLRDVSAAAGQRNHSAAQYHFADRRGLVGAVYEARMGEISARRALCLNALAAGDRLDDIGGLVESFVAPLVEVVSECSGWYGRFLARTRWDTLAWSVLTEVPSAASVLDVERRIGAQLVGLSTTMRRHRVDQLLTLVIGTIAGWEAARDRDEAHLSADELTADLVATGLALLGAPVSPSSVTSTSPHRTIELSGAHT